MKRTLLIVDDNLEYRKVVGFYLKLKSPRTLEIIEAERAQEAIDILKHKKCDVLISDWELPHLNGSHLLDHLKEKNIQYPIFILSSSIHAKTDHYTFTSVTTFQRNHLVEACDQILKSL